MYLLANEVVKMLHFFTLHVASHRTMCRVVQKNRCKLWWGPMCQVTDQSNYRYFTVITLTFIKPNQLNPWILHQIVAYLVSSFSPQQSHFVVDFEMGYLSSHTIQKFDILDSVWLLVDGWHCSSFITVGIELYNGSSCLHLCSAHVSNV